MRKLVQHELLLFVQKVQGPLRRSVGYCQIQIRYFLFLNRWWNEQLMYMTVHHHPRPYFHRKTSNLSSLKLVIKQLIVVFCDPGKNPSLDRKSTRLNSSHVAISYADFCLKKKKTQPYQNTKTKNKT